MRAEYEKYKKGELDFNDNIGLDSEGADIFGTPKSAVFTPYRFQDDESDSLKIIDKFFGYDFFTVRDTLKFWENLPTPKDYLLGPGDELIISLWGETQLRENYTISRDGSIYDEKVGLLVMMGKSLNDARKYLVNQYGRVYSTIKGNKPTTYLEISLGQLRSINVNFVGEVNYPGVYPIHPFSTVITGLIQAGGVDTTGTLRNIQIIRQGEIQTSIDLYDYFLKGKLPNNIRLYDQDIIVVPVRLSSVQIDSAVVRPGIYESKKEETIFDMVEYAGGLKSDASTSISLQRTLPLADRSEKISNNENYYIDYKNSNLTFAQDGDIITLRNAHKTISQVEIIGQVKSPGIYHYYPGMKLKELISLGGGFEDTTFLKSIYLNSGELVRRNPSNRYEKVFSIDLNDIIDNKPTANLSLQNLDKFVVHANPNFFEKENIQILGEVNIPGSYPLISDNETLEILLNRAGGLTSKALADGVSIFREKKYFDEGSVDRDENQIDKTYEELKIDFDIKEENEEENWIRVAWQNEKVILMPGDSIVVKEKTGTVNVSGAVYNPGLIEFQNGKSLKYYVDSAGGVKINGDKNDIIVIYANGVIKPKKLFNSPKIQDGSTIIVNQKELSEPFNPTEFASTTLSLISSIVTIMVLSKQLNTN